MPNAKLSSIRCLFNTSKALTSQHNRMHLRRRRDVHEGAVGDDVVEAAALDLHPVSVLLAPRMPALQTGSIRMSDTQ